MTWELLRSRWAFPALTTLQDGPLTSGRLLHRINEGAARNADLLGARVLHLSVLLTGLRQMEEEKLLLTRGPGSDSREGLGLWELTAAGRELLRAMDGMAVWAAGHRGPLTTTLRRRSHQQGSLDPGELILTAEQERQRATGMALEVVRPRWAFAVLCQLGHGPQPPTGVTEAVNAGIDRNRDLTGRRSLSEKMFWDTLHRLVDAGLVVHRSRPGRIAATACCTLAPVGHALLEAVEPVGEWALGHEQQLLVVVRRRRELPVDGS